LFDKLKSLNILNEEIGWLSVYDPEIIDFYRGNTTDKDLLKEIEKVESKKWFKISRKGLLRKTDF